MTRFFLLVALLCSANLTLAQDYDFYECGDSRDEARSNLAVALVSDVISEASQGATSLTFFGIELASRNDELKQQVSTNLKLTDVKVKKEQGRYCAYINRADLLKTAKNYYQQSRSYQKSNLPKKVRPRINMLEQWLNDLDQLRLLGILYSSEFPRGWQNTVQRQIKTLKDERSRLHPQAVVIQVNNKASQVYLAGKKVRSGEEHYLPQGKYEYRVKTPGYCQAVGQLELEKNSDKRIKVDLDDYRYPVMQINSNKPKQVRLMVNGQRRKVGESFTVKRCDGELAVVASFEGESKSRSYQLEPGAELDDNFRFYSAKELRELQQLAAQFSSGNRLEIKYGYSYLPDEVENSQGMEFDGLHQLKLNYLSMNKWLRHGPGIMLAQAKGKYSGDLVYNLGLQLTDIGKGEPFHVFGAVAFVPFINMQLGVGYHEYVSEDGERFIHNFREDVDDEEEEFARDFLVARLGGGLDISVSKWVGIQLFADKSFTQEKTTQAGIGLTLKMP